MIIASFNHTGSLIYALFALALLFLPPILLGCITSFAFSKIFKTGWFWLGTPLFGYLWFFPYDWFLRNVM